MVVVASTPERAAAQDAGAVAGLYVCDGVSPDGERYRALLELVPFGEHVRARWTFRDGPPVLGLGMVRHGVLAISYFGPGTVGLVVYRLERHGITVGEWVIVGAQGVYRESVTKLPDDHVPQPDPVPPPDDAALPL
jgi:hypothetical protein